MPGPPPKRGEERKTNGTDWFPAAATTEGGSCESVRSEGPRFVTGGRKRSHPLITQLKWTGNVPPCHVAGCHPTRRQRYYYRCYYCHYRCYGIERDTLLPLPRTPFALNGPSIAARCFSDRVSTQRCQTEIQLFLSITILRFFTSIFRGSSFERFHFARGLCFMAALPELSDSEVLCIFIQPLPEEKFIFLYYSIFSMIDLVCYFNFKYILIYCRLAFFDTMLLCSITLLQIIIYVEIHLHRNGLSNYLQN